MNLDRVYDFEHHVRIGEELDLIGKLPPIFMLLPPHSWHEDVWTDVMQARSLNTVQAAAGAEKHLCPLPFDIVDRLILQLSQPGEMVFDPFCGLGTVPYRALKHGRRGSGTELNPDYWLDSCKHLEAMAREVSTPTLFAALGLSGPLASAGEAA
jgi:DNA modification methylase